MTAVLTLEAVTVLRRTTRILDGVSLSVDRGEVVALLGPSGSGKSTIIRLLLGLLAPERGTVRIRDRVASDGRGVRMAPEERELSVVFQNLALWPHLTVGGNLRFVLQPKKLPREQEAQRVSEMLARVGLAGKETQYPGELSGGEQQRVAIARALVGSPSAILLDEPLGNLDVVLKAELLDLLSSLLGGGTAALYVTHDPREAARLARRIVVLERGHIVQQGSFAELRAAPATPFVERVLEDLSPIG